MTKQELLKQADYTFQRGNRELAMKYLSEYLASYPNDEAAWMLMARITGEREHQIACYERTLKLNPNNNEAKIGLVRIRAAATPTLPRTDAKSPNTNLWQPKSKPYKNTLRGVLATVAVFVLFGMTALVVARNNPTSKVAQMLAMTTSTPYANSSFISGVASQTRAEVDEKFPQYSPLVDALIGFAVDNAQNGMEGAPERPGDEIIISDQAGIEAKAMLAKALPQPGSLSSVTITEQQVTSWLVMEMKDNPDLPLSDIQVFLRNGQIQVWGIVNGSASSTSMLIVGEIKIDENKQPYFKIESMQIGQQVVPDLLISQMETWLNQMVLEGVDEQAPGLEVMNVKVTSGLITVSGMR